MPWWNSKKADLGAWGAREFSRRDRIRSLQRTAESMYKEEGYKYDGLDDYMEQCGYFDFINQILAECRADPKPGT